MPQPAAPVHHPEPLQDSLLGWYDRHHRSLPWRVSPGDHAAGRRPDPYHVWLSEIMLQQTTVAAVRDYFLRFIDRWPSVHALAAAELDEVLHAWQGLGYYARARNLHKCAQAVAGAHGGRFPETEDALRALPGIGPYTAAAIAAIAFDRAALPVDGNVERVTARLFALETPLPDGKTALRERAEALTPSRRCGDFAQALMDLGATVCTPTSPKCLVCPWQADCAAHARGIAAELPRKRPKPAKPTRRGVAFWILRADGAVLLRRRPERGLLGGMMEVPSSEWREGAAPNPAVAADDAPLAPNPTAGWRNLPGLVRHTFTHFHLELTVLAGRTGHVAAPPGAVWSPIDRLGDHALPSVMKKVVRHALRHAGGGPPA